MSVRSMPPEYSQPEVQDSLSPAKTRQILEAALLTAQEPLPFSELRKLFNNELSAAVLANLLEEVREEWRDSGIELVTVASGWRFQTKAEMQSYLERLTPQKAPRYSRAILETLAIIAYRQPVTRGDIEEIRGVGVSSAIIKTLMARGWIEAVGHRNVPGKPELFATTAHFLDDLNLRSIEELPPLEEMKSLLESGSENEHLPLEQPEASGH
ncbi:SMC-Scp complex subunit ScpB [Nitrosomonas oligotropha]|uniref:Condensin subunit ScpB n=1 Tax=Nitrosomonas oligotropha TaxID=42354 RepID=A0A1H8J0F5_9PROT|nr:SMC-Scp complex subunit ScpB [Nitrosomonas oligotropha]SDW09334.1 condensin subunit ScpB [Nitrosomonas oligotropha]SEN74460.1 condensin subunit ScpB [Nitrosomonas oligotropha]